MNQKATAVRRWMNHVARERRDEWPTAQGSAPRWKPALSGAAGVSPRGSTYPQCASYVGYSIDKYGLESFKQIWVKEDLENTIQKVYKKSLEGLENEWLSFLAVH
ncbi:hypothetical protein KKB83_04365 [Patescibacteria group bacterium]|nr:hypothetical protein [Patescibacteria group bacterium]